MLRPAYFFAGVSLFRIQCNLSTQIKIGGGTEFEFAVIRNKP
jgi:hypothetical protein